MTDEELSYMLSKLFINVITWVVLHLFIMFIILIFFYNWIHSDAGQTFLMYWLGIMLIGQTVICFKPYRLPKN